MAALESNPSWIECVSTNSSTLVVNGTLTVDDGGRVNHGRWLMIVVAIGLLANFAFLLVVARCESMRNVTNVYLANLAIADIIVLIVCAIPLPRYCVVVYLERIITSEKCEVYGVTSPNNPLIESCNKTHGFNPSPSLSDVFKVLPFVLCLSMNCWLYARIVKNLRNRFVHRMNRPNQQVPEWIRKIHQSRVRITRMLALNSFIFLLCNTPRCVTTISGYIHDTLGEPRWDADQKVQMFSSMLLLVNSSINPLIYNLTNKQYRQAFRQVFLPSCRSASRPSQTTPTVFHLQISSD
ncbi:thyrotropin-releasing hormone receptor-like [Patiria miniata]|uniref:G-protein coupled receptors family 1 profile domain-containing protein n=1 Tax=Patiria miniata TaxID=46514 RepID=A0A914AZW0_PATMI|nr:thyrotropin-releasing hormone receptor-like [Patiria miniata]